MSTTGLSSIGQIALEVRNLENAVAFYRDKLGLAYLFSAPPGLAFFDCNGLRLMLTIPEKAASGEVSNSTLYFKVDDIQAIHKSLLAKGVPFDDAPHLIAHMQDHELWMAFMRDPDGNLLGIMCEIPLAESAN